MLTLENAHSHPLPAAPTDEYWRAIVRTTIGEYLGPDFAPDNPPNVTTTARKFGFEGKLDPQAVDKSERYAAMGALISLTTDELVAGNGVESRFTSITGDKMDDIEQNAYDAFLVARDAAISPDTRGSEIATHLRTFSRAANTALTFIGAGGTAPAEIKNFNTLVPAAMMKNPHTRTLPKAGRIALGHGFTNVSLSRAGAHLDSLHYRPKWLDLTTNILVTTAREANSKEGVEAVYRLTRHSDGKPLFSLWRKVYEQFGPLIKCPAHQQIFGDETALSRILHAGVNEAARRGAYQ